MESYFEQSEMQHGGAPARRESQRSHVPPNSGLLPGIFLKSLEAEVRRACERRSQPLQTRARSRLAQFWFGPVSSIHYEVWVHDRTSQLEIGFHCESTPDYNRLLYALLDASLVEIQAKVGSSFWLEDWDKGWIRLYETQRLWPLDSSRVSEVAERLVELIGAVQPLYEQFAARNPPPPTGPNRHDRRP